MKAKRTQLRAQRSSIIAAEYEMLALIILDEKQFEIKCVNKFSLGDLNENLTYSIYKTLHIYYNNVLYLSYTCI